jgi:hypothetical protein
LQSTHQTKSFALLFNMSPNTKLSLLATAALITSMTLPVLAAPLDADVYERDVAFTEGGDLVERQPFFGLMYVYLFTEYGQRSSICFAFDSKAGLGILGSLGKKRKRDLAEIDELSTRELLEELAVEMRSFDDTLEFDAREFDEVEEVEMRDFDELEFEAREIDADMFDLAERDFELESLDAYVPKFLLCITLPNHSFISSREYGDLEEMD